LSVRFTDVISQHLAKTTLFCALPNFQAFALVGFKLLCKQHVKSGAIELLALYKFIIIIIKPGIENVQRR